MRSIVAHIEDSINAGAGTAEQITERFAAMLEPGLIDHIVLQLPTGDMTYDEARRTVELFVSEVKPQPGKCLARSLEVRSRWPAALIG